MNKKSIMAFVKQNTIWMTFFGSSIIVLILAIVTSMMMVSSGKTIEETSRQHILALSRAAALLVSADELDMFMQEQDMQRPEYAALNHELMEFNDISETEYTYYLRLVESENKMQFIIDNSVDTEALSMPLVDREHAPDIALTGLANAVEFGSYSENWEGYMTAYAPVYYSNGRLSNIVAGVDMLDVYIRQSQQNMHTLSTLLIIFITMVLGFCLYSLLLYQRKAKQALSASEAKSSFLSRMSHEIRTPLNAIIGFCNMSMASNHIREIKQYLGHINSASLHLFQVINDVLDISKIETGKVVLEYLACELRHEVKQIDDIIRPQAEKKKLNFSIDMDERVPAFVLCDAVRLKQVIVNLLSNALKFTPESGKVSLSVSLEETRGNQCKLVWAVEDSGIGISEKQKQKLFRPFEQADVSTTRKYGGTGLGLTISQNLVEMMGGHIQLDSCVGVGSKFYFSLWLDMIDDQTMATQNAAGDMDPTIDLTGREILVVEDVETNQMIIQYMLEGYGAHVTLVNDGQEGYDAYVKNPDRFCLILMDIQMPVLDGYEATKKIRSSDCPNAKTIPIVAMTANVYKEDVEKAKECGMNDHIGKPFDATQIEHMLVNLGMSALE